MAVAFRSAATAGAATSTAPSVTKPTGVVDGDLLVAIQFADRGGTAASITGPAGTWTLAGSDSTLHAGVGDAKVWWRVASSEPASYTFGHSTAADDVCAILAFQSGTFDTTTPLANITFAGSATTSTTHTAPSVTSIDGGMLVSAFMAGDNATATATRTWSGYTAGLTQASSVGTSSLWVGMATAYQALTGTAATGQKSATCTDSSPFLGMSLVVQPAGAQNYTPSAAEISTSTDAVTRTTTKQASAGAEVSTSTDTLRFNVGKTAVEASTSTDAASHTKANTRNPAETSLSSDGVRVEYTRADIGNYQFVIVEDDPNTMNPWVPFGAGQAIAGRFTPGAPEVTDQDVNAVLGDYRMFGVDRHTAPTWAWSLFTDTGSPEDALAWVDLMTQVWNHKVRKSPEQVLALRYKVGGRVRRVYGRPRRLTPIPDAIQNGKIHIEADFALAEPIYYDDDESMAGAGLTPAYNAAAGIILPQPLPWVFTTQPPPQTGQAIISGTAATWVDIDIYGPTTNPWVKIGNLTWGLGGSLENGQKVTVSGKPWSMGVRREDGTNLPGWLDPRSRLSALQMEPGTYSVQFGGWDNTGTSRVVLRWRQAHQSL